MIRLAALSLTPGVYARLRQGGPARVLHVFEHVVNLSMADQVLSLVTETIGNGPFNVVIPACDFRRHVPVADTLTMVPNALHIGDLVVDLSSAALWNPTPDWLRLRSAHARLRAQIPQIRAVLRQRAPASSWAVMVVDLPAVGRSELDAACLENAQRHWHTLHQALIDLRETEAIASARQLVGLGRGLTPSGDDWLVGCGLAAQLNLPSPEAAALLLKTIDLTSSGTTQLSSAWLQAAVNGLCNAHWHRFFAACQRSDSGQVYEAARQIVAVGHTSGADALAGYLAIIES